MQKMSRPVGSNHMIALSAGGGIRRKPLIKLTSDWLLSKILLYNAVNMFDLIDCFIVAFASNPVLMCKIGNPLKKASHWR